MQVASQLPAGAPAAGSSRDKRLEGAARDFEALMISELLRAARVNGSAGWTGEEDSAADSAFGLAEEHFARALAGTLGLARLVMNGLDPTRSSSATPAETSGTP